MHVLALRFIPRALDPEVAITASCKAQGREHD